MLSPNDGEFCLEQAKRLGVFGYLGEEESEEFAEALRGAFDTRDQVRAAVDEFVRWDTRPVPAQIWHHARQQRGDTRLAYCEECDGTGWVPARMVESTTGATQFYDDVPPNETVLVADQSAGVRLCSCRAGMGGGR